MKFQKENLCIEGQTPQTFRRKNFLHIYESLNKTYIKKVTDAVGILVEYGNSVGLVRGDEFNIKITTEYDLRIASFLLESKYD